jgi:hypothetical protein
MIFDLGGIVVDANTEILIFAYDQYLNYSTQGGNPFTGLSDREEPACRRVCDTVVLNNNQPNPFNLATRINYEIPDDAHVNLSVFDVSGRLVRVLVNGPRGIGQHSAEWDGRNCSGKLVASGAYFYSLRVGDRPPVSKRMVLVK